MSFHTRLATAFGMAMILSFSVLGTSRAAASAQHAQVRIADRPESDPAAGHPDTGNADVSPEIAAEFTTAQPHSDDIVAQPLADAPVTPDAAAGQSQSAGNSEAGLAASAASLDQLVAMTAIPDSVPRDIACMAGAIYFEAKSESLAGQLAVGRVIIARTQSGRFPTSYCGVVLQHAQFSFVRGGSMPIVDHGNRFWQQAVKIALIADRGGWKSTAEGALFFHAARVSGPAGKTRIARIENHIFYR